MTLRRPVGWNLWYAVPATFWTTMGATRTDHFVTVGNQEVKGPIDVIAFAATKWHRSQNVVVVQIQFNQGRQSFQRRGGHRPR
jgi:hypothetical protein